MTRRPHDDTAAAGDMLAAALDYAARVWPVLPLAGKVPRIEGGLTRASTEVAVVADWWRRWPDAAVGIRTGAESGLVVLDEDTPKGGAGTLARLEAELGPVPDTYAVLTGGGGRHFYFQHPGGTVPCSAGKLGPGLDVRADGGYVVAPPSVHESGRPYKVLHERELAALPATWLERIVGATTNGNAATAPRVTRRIPAGERNAVLASVAGTMRRRGISQDAIGAALRVENDARCDPPLPADEVDAIAASISRYAAEADAFRVEQDAYKGPPRALEDAVAVFSRWLLLPDLAPVYAVLGAAAANYLPGAPVWLVVVSPPSNGKTELLGSLSRLPDVHPASVLTVASLLSGSPKREHASGAKGGLLREVGEFGLVVLKDMGSLLSMRPDDKAEVFAALREVFDGSYVRYVGADGGKQLAWTGKLGLIAGATPVLDRHHGVLSVMGERFLLVRLPEAVEEQAERALEHTGDAEDTMRRELADAVAGLFAAERAAPRTLEPDERHELVGLAALVARARSPVERDSRTREVELIPGAEGPARLAVTLERLLAGLDTLGCERRLALDVVRRVGLDSMPAIRRRLLEQLCAIPDTVSTTTIAVALDSPTNTVRRSLEDLAAYKLVTRTKQEQGKPDLWRASEWARERFA